MSGRTLISFISQHDLTIIELLTAISVLIAFCTYQRNKKPPKKSSWRLEIKLTRDDS